MNVKAIAVCCTLAAIIVILVVVPLTFSYVPINFMAFRKNTLSNDVDRSTVYPNGRYAWGPSFSPITFSSIFKRLDITGISIFTSGGLAITFDCVLYYLLTPSTLSQLYGAFGLSYEARIVSTASAAVRNAAAGATIDQFVNAREALTASIYQRVRDELAADVYVTVPSSHFMIQGVTLPSSVLAQKLSIFDVAQREIVANNSEAATLVRLTTVRLVTALENEAALVAVNATFVTSRLVAEAMSGATAAVGNAKSGLMGEAVMGLGINATREQFVLANQMLDANGTLSLTLVRGLTSAVIST